MRRIFISDLHLQDSKEPAFLALDNLIKTETSDLDELYILGDLCEAWVGDDDDSGFVEQLTKLLNQASDNCRVFFMHGNRDFLIGEVFAKNSQITLLADPYLLDDKLLLSHGDQYCTEDVDYMQLRSMVRSKDWQKTVLDQPLEVRRKMAADLRQQSISAGANKAENITDVTSAAVIESMKSFGAATLIHGHTHRPGIHRVTALGQPVGKRMVLGDWGHCQWLIRQVDEVFQLECRSLVALN